jgi:hypothetical protein
VTLHGEAFLAMWHDITPAGEAEFNAWHTREHMPERVAVPGFEVGRRYVDWQLDSYRYFTLYEGRTLDVFQSAPYLARLNAPTPWSIKVQPSFLNFIRCACRTVCSAGRGFGGALLTARLDFAAHDGSVFTTEAPALVNSLSGLDGVTGVHVGLAEPSVTSVRTRETALKGLTTEGVFDGVVLVEAYGRPQLESLRPRIAELIATSGVAAAQTAVYDLAYLLFAEGAP